MIEVAFITDYYPFYGGRVVFELVKRMQRYGVRTKVISSSIFAENQDLDAIRLKASTVAIRGTPYMIYNLHDLFKLPCLVKEADIVNLHFTIFPLSLCYGALKRFHVFGSPIVATPHGLPTGYPSITIKYVASLLFFFSKMLVLDDASAITAVSKGEYIFFRNKYQDKIVEYIPNGVDTSIFRPDPRKRQRIRDEFHLADDDVLVLYLAGLRSQKGVFLFLDAIRSITKKNVKIAFLIAGPGPLASHVRAFVDGQRNRKIYAIPKYVPHGYVTYLYNACDIYVLPSYHETMPLSVMEAMACGKPIVSTSVGDIPLLVKNGINGFLVPPNSVKSLTDSINLLAEKPEIREAMGRRNVIKMREYDWNKIAQKYYRLYREVLTS